MNLELHIDELVLDGFPNIDNARVSAALTAALTELFEQRGVPPALQQFDGSAALAGSTIQVGRTPTPEAVGTQIAQCLYNRMSAPSGEPQDAISKAGTARAESN